MPPLKPSETPKIGKNVGSSKAFVGNPFLNYSSGDMAAIGAMHSNRASSGKKGMTSRDSAVSNSVGSATSISSSGSREKVGGKQKQQQVVVDRKKDQDKTHIFS